MCFIYLTSEYVEYVCYIFNVVIFYVLGKRVEQNMFASARGFILSEKENMGYVFRTLTTTRLPNLNVQRCKMSLQHVRTDTPHQWNQLFFLLPILNYCLLLMEWRPKSKKIIYFFLANTYFVYIFITRQRLRRLSAYFFVVHKIVDDSVF